MTAKSCSLSVERGREGERVNKQGWESDIYYYTVGGKKLFRIDGVWFICFKYSGTLVNGGSQVFTRSSLIVILMHNVSHDSHIHPSHLANDDVNTLYEFKAVFQSILPYTYYASGHYYLGTPLRCALCVVWTVNSSGPCAGFPNSFLHRRWNFFLSVRRFASNPTVVNLTTK